MDSVNKDKERLLEVVRERIARGDVEELRLHKGVSEKMRDLYLGQLNTVLTEIDMYKAAIREVEDKDQLAIEFTPKSIDDAWDKVETPGINWEKEIYPGNKDIPPAPYVDEKIEELDLP